MGITIFPENEEKWLSFFLKKVTEFIPMILKRQLVVRLTCLS